MHARGELLQRGRRATAPGEESRIDGRLRPTIGFLTVHRDLKAGGDHLTKRH